MQEYKAGVVAGGIRLPNSCVKVLDVLSGHRHSDGISQQLIIKETGLSERAVKYALKEVVQRKLAFFRILLNDTRRKLYFYRGMA
ncbi:hypothetical protein HYU17_05340 [Candidatus Woesearchaeota archaeon]|nr:hypothetical protein [Candidatus Woesearchaeota archaeon]